MADGPVKKTYGAQMLGSLGAAVLIVALAIWAVTARLGPTSIAEQEAVEERQEEAAEEAQEAQEDAAEAMEEAAGGGDEGGKRRRRGRDR